MWTALAVRASGSFPRASAGRGARWALYGGDGLEQPQAQPPRGRDQPVPVAARPQPRGLVPVGPGGAHALGLGAEADLSLDRLLGLSLVSRDGARELRGSRD